MSENEKLREALEKTRDCLRGLQPALNVMAREVLDDIISDQIDAALSTPPSKADADDVESIKHMVDRFLMWKLPPDFSPDNGISFDRVVNLGTEHQYNREPVGTNLLTAMQAEAMVRFMLEGLPAIQNRDAGLREALIKCRNQFDFYVQQHMAKSPPDTQKARTNQECVDMINAALLTEGENHG